MARAPTVTVRAKGIRGGTCREPHCGEQDQLDHRGATCTSYHASPPSGRTGLCGNHRGDLSCHGILLTRPGSEALTGAVSVPSRRRGAGDRALDGGAQHGLGVERPQEVVVGTRACATEQPFGEPHSKRAVGPIRRNHKANARLPTTSHGFCRQELSQLGVGRSTMVRERDQ